MGACVEAATSAPMPTIAYASGRIVALGMMCASATPKAPPVAAPT